MSAILCSPKPRRFEANYFPRSWLQLTSADSIALNHTNEHDDDGYNEQDVNEATHRVRRDESEQPGDDQNKSDGVEHRIMCLWLS